MFFWYWRSSFNIWCRFVKGREGINFSQERELIMTDPISHQTRIAQSNGAVRSSLDKLDKSKGTQLQAEASKASAPKPSQGDTVNLTNVQQKIKDAPDFDRSKVESIKKAIREGNYPIDPKRIAQNFVSLEKMIQG